MWIRTRADTDGQVHSLVALRLRGISAEADADSGPDSEGVDSSEKKGVLSNDRLHLLSWYTNLIRKMTRGIILVDYIRWDYHLITPCYSG